MWSFASHVRVVRTLARTQPDQLDAAELVRHLDAVAVIARDVAQKTLLPEHVSLKKNIQGFLREIDYARSGVVRRPQNLGPAANIGGACAYCHDLKACPFDVYQRCVDVPIY